MDNEKLFEAVRLLKKHCSNTRCSKCAFDKGGCALTATITPSLWEIPTHRRWTDNDIALAKALKAFGAENVHKLGNFVFTRFDNGYSEGMPDGAFADLEENEEISIEDIIAEGETA